MRSLILSTPLALIAGQAFAHAGHIAPASGHHHAELLAGLAVIAALGIPAAIAWLRRR